MKKKIFLVVLGPVMFTPYMFGQKPQPTVPAAYPDANLAVYKNAIALHDYGTAIHALHYIIAVNPTGAPYADTLALLYAQTGQYVQADLLVDIQINTRGYSDMRMEVKAVCNKNLNNAVVAINSYNMLYEKTRNPVFGFEKLQLEYGIKRLAEAGNTASQLLNMLPANDSTQLQVMRLDKTIQLVPLRAGILNLQGAAFADLNQKALAQEALQAALALAPDFEQAKNTLKAIASLQDKRSAQVERSGL